MSRRRWGAIALGVLAVSVVTACTEKLEGGAACPALCPEQSIVVRDTTIDALSLDTSIVAFPTLGQENYMVLATRGDTLDARGVVRFDTLATHYTHNAADSAITVIDSTMLTLRIDTTAKKVTAPITIEAYDVDTTAADTALNAATVVVPLFRRDRLLGSVTLVPDSVRDTLRVPLSNIAILGKLSTSSRLRVGLRAVSSASVQLRLFTRESGSPVTLSYRPSPDTAVHRVVVSPSSLTPADHPGLAQDLTDYNVVVRSSAAVLNDVIAVGGLPSRRAFLRFNLPSSIVDSTTVLRATLILTQRPNRSLDQRDSLLIYSEMVAASTEITDITRSANIIASATTIAALDSLKATPADSGVRTFEIARAVALWKAQPKNGPTQRAIVLRTPLEGAATQQLRFFSSRAPAALRPRVRLSYVPRVSFGAP